MRTSFCLIISSIIYAQAGSLNSTKLSRIQILNNINQEKLYVKNTSLASTIFLPLHIGPNKNIALSSFLISDKKNPSFNLVPVLVGGIKVSWNLSLIGRMSAYSNEKKAINIYGWGLSFKPGQEEKISPWNIGVNSGVYRSFNNIRSSSFGLSVMRQITLRNLDMFLGISSNNVKGVDYKSDQNLDSQNFQYNFSNFIIGSKLELMGLEILPNFNYSLGNFVMSIGFQKEY